MLRGVDITTVGRSGHWLTALCVWVACASPALAETRKTCSDTATAIRVAEESLKQNDVASDRAALVCLVAAMKVLKAANDDQARQIEELRAHTRRLDRERFCFGERCPEQ